MPKALQTRSSRPSTIKGPAHAWWCMNISKTLGACAEMQQSDIAKEVGVDENQQQQIGCLASWIGQLSPCDYIPCA